MKKISYFLLTLILVPLLFLCGCNNSKSDINYEQSKVMALGCNYNDWNGFKSIKVVDGVEQSTYSAKKTIQNNQTKIDYIYESDELNVYCKDNVRYYIDNNQKYMDEEEFISDGFIETTLSDYANNLDKQIFTNSNLLKNTPKFISSKKVTLDIGYYYEIKFGFKDSKDILVSKYYFDKNDVFYKIEIYLDSSVDISITIEENDELINTPEWFDSNDYKQDLTYEQMCEIVSDTTLFDGWQGAEINFPQGYSQNETYGDLSCQKIYKLDDGTTKTKINFQNADCFYDGENVFYVNQDGIKSISDNKDFMNRYCDFDVVLENFANQTFRAFMSDELKEYYVSSKKYVKNKTIASYKLDVLQIYNDDPNDYWHNDAIVSLFYNTEGKLYYVDIYTSLESSSYPENNFVYHITLKKTDNNYSIDWFDKSMYENL